MYNKKYFMKREDKFDLFIDNVVDRESFFLII